MKQAMQLGIVLMLAGATGCQPDGTAEDPDEAAMPAPTIEQTLEAHTDEWMRVPGVVGTGIGLCDGSPCILVLVEKQTQQIAEKIPGAVDGHRVSVQETGPIEAL